jgi:hypothetical protein
MDALAFESAPDLAATIRAGLAAHVDHENTRDAKVAALAKAKELAAADVLRRGLKGLRAEVTERALVDHYFAQLASGRQVAA